MRVRQREREGEREGERDLVLILILGSQSLDALVDIGGNLFADFDANGDLVLELYTLLTRARSHFKCMRELL